MIANPRLRWAVVAVCLILVSGCSFGDGGEGGVPPTSGETVAPTDVLGQAEKLIGPKMPKGSTLECPDPLAAVVKSTTTCTWSSPDGSSIGMTLTVTDIEDGRASLHFKNDDAVTPSPSS